MRPNLYYKLSKLVDELLISFDDGIKNRLRTSEHVIAEPKSPLRAHKLVEKERTYIPTSVGADGFVYGVVEGSNKIWRSEDGMSTIEEVERDFYQYGDWYPYWVTKTHSGYVVITGARYADGNPDVGAIYFGEEFDGPYERKTGFTPNHTPCEFGITCYHGITKGEQIILVAERGYPTGSEEKGKIRGTFDGGQTWEVLKNVEVENPNQNTHFHTAVYDPYRGRIWASQGDGDNAMLLISDDLGKTWRRIFPENKVGKVNFQPTLLLPLANNIVYGADTSPGNVGLWKIPVDKMYNGFVENFSLEKGAFCWDQVVGFHNYPISSFAVDGNVAYCSMPSRYQSGKSFVMATGDGGNTWHTVAGFNYSQVLSRGIVGPDNSGFLYGVWDSPDEPNTTIVFEPIEWLYK